MTSNINVISGKFPDELTLLSCSFFTLYFTYILSSHVFGRIQPKHCYYSVAMQFGCIHVKRLTEGGLFWKLYFCIVHKCTHMLLVKCAEVLCCI